MGRNLYPIITMLQLLSLVNNYSDYHKVISTTELHRILIYKIYHDVTIFSQPIVHCYGSLYGVNVILFNLPIHNTSFDSNIDLFIINSPLNIYRNSIQAGLALLCINKIPSFIYTILTSCIRHIKSILAPICQHYNKYRVQTCHIY